jgi:predicted transcriptional regulator of viral defense system
MLACSRPKKTIEFQGTRIRFFKMKQISGYGKKSYRNFDIFVADKEKCIIDSILLKNVPFDEIVKALRDKSIDTKKLSENAIRSGNKSLLKRLGYILESLGLDSGQLSNRLDSNFIRLDWNGPRNGENAKRWKLIINRRLDDID